MDILTCHSRKTDHVIGVGVSLLLWGEGESEQAVGVVGIPPPPLRITVLGDSRLPGMFRRVQFRSFTYWLQHAWGNKLQKPSSAGSSLLRGDGNAWGPSFKLQWHARVWPAELHTPPSPKKSTTDSRSFTKVFTRYLQWIFINKMIKDPTHHVSDVGSYITSLVLTGMGSLGGKIYRHRKKKKTATSQCIIFLFFYFFF